MEFTYNKNLLSQNQRVLSSGLLQYNSNVTAADVSLQAQVTAQYLGTCISIPCDTFLFKAASVALDARHLFPVVAGDLFAGVLPQAN